MGGLFERLIRALDPPCMKIRGFGSVVIFADEGMVEMVDLSTRVNKDATLNAIDRACNHKY